MCACHALARYATRSDGSPGMLSLLICARSLNNGDNASQWTTHAMCSIDPSVLNKSGTVFGDSALSHPARPRHRCSRVAFTTDLSCQHSAADLVSQGRKVACEFALVGQLVRLRVAPEPTRCQDVLRRKDRGQKRLPNGLIMRRAR